MPTTKKKAREKLGEGSIGEMDILCQEKVRTILKAIIEKCDRDGYAKSSLKKSWERSGIGDRYVDAIVDYLYEHACIKMERIPARGRSYTIKVTKKGRSELLVLEDFLKPPKQDMLSLLPNSGDNDYKVELSIDGKNLSNIERISILLTPEVL